MGPVYQVHEGLYALTNRLYVMFWHSFMNVSTQMACGIDQLFSIDCPIRRCSDSKWPNFVIIEYATPTPS